MLSGVPDLPGSTVADKMAYFRDHHDWIRTAMVLEPRGGNLTSAAMLVPACHPGADIGVFFMEPFGYPPMCGNDTVGLVTMLIDSGQIAASGDSATVLVEATARIVDGIVRDVTFNNVTAFVTARDGKIEVPNFGIISADVACGGNFYVIADAAQFGLTLEATNTSAAITAAEQLLTAANAAIPPLTRPMTPSPGSRKFISSATTNPRPLTRGSW